MRATNKYVNQSFKYVTIVPTFKCSLLVFGIFSFVFLFFGLLSLLYACKNHDIEVPYNCKSLPTCRVTFKPEATLTSPVNFYYKITNFYTSYKTYVKSSYYKQYAGKVL